MATPAQLFTENVNKDLERKHVLEDEQRKQNLAFNWGVLNNPDATPEQKTAAKQSIDSLYPSAQHGPLFLNDLRNLVGKAFGHSSQPSASASPSPASATPPPSGQEPTSPSSALPTATNPADILQGAKPQLAQVAQAPDASAALAAIQGKKKQTPAEIAAPGYASQAAIQNKFAKELSRQNFEQNEKIWGVRGQTAENVANIRADALKASLAARPPRMLSQTTIPQFLKEIEVDPEIATSMVGPDGNPITVAQLSEMPQNMVVREFRAGPNVFYAFGDQNAKTGTFGGITYQIPSLGPVSTDNSTALGVATPMIPKTHEVPGMNPGEKVKLTSAPSGTPGMTPQAPLAAPPSPQTSQPSPTLKQRPQTAAAEKTLDTVPLSPPKLPPSPSAQAVVKKANQGRSQSKQIPQPSGEQMPPAFAPGTPLTQGRPAMPVVSAMSVVASNIFGSHGDKPIWDNAWMYDKPELRQALNNALTLNAIQHPDVEEPGLLDGLKRTLGITQWTQEQINQAEVDARQKVEQLGGPEALKQFNRMAAMQEDLSALRAATKASAAQGSLNLAVRAAPVYNISSAQDFRNQLGTMLATAVSSMHGYPMINPAYVNWWDKGVAAAKNSPSSHETARQAPIIQFSKSRNASRYSTDGGRTWVNGLPPQQQAQ